MKNTTLFLVLCLVFMLLACEPTVTFTEPQPAGTKDLSQFPTKLHGRYLNISDSSFLEIDALSVRVVYDFDMGYHINDLDSTEKLIGDTLFDEDNDLNLQVVRKGDSLFAHIHHVEVVFAIADDSFLRKFKGQYFMSKPVDDLGYEVLRLKTQKTMLTIGWISSKEELDALNELDDIIQDTVKPFQFDLSKRQLKAFVKKGGFTNEEHYIKLR